GVGHGHCNLAETVTAGGNGPRLVSLEIRGFRAFGTEARTLQLDAPLVVLHAGNSQGKTSLTEAIEFLISGRSSRRDMLGGSKAEYHDSLRNAHLPASDTEVYVQAVVRDGAGVTHQVRRELLCDFGQGTECDSRLLIDGIEANDLDQLGLPLADPPVRAPVLLQHTLRHVLSTEPKQRVGYFKALLSLTDLDHFRERVRAARGRVDAEQPGNAVRFVGTLAGTPAAAVGETIIGLTKKPITAEAATAAVHCALLNAGKAVLAARSDAAPDFDDLDALDTAIASAMEDQREQAFPLSAFTASPLPVQAIEPPDVGAYHEALMAVDQLAAQHTPVFEAVLGIHNYATLDHAVECPVCGTDNALTPNRINLLREHLHRTQTLTAAARSATQTLADARRDLDQLAQTTSRTVPTAAQWTSEQLTQATDDLRVLGIDAALAIAARARAGALAAAAAAVTTSATQVRGDVERAGDAVAARHPIAVDLDEGYRGVTTTVEHLATAVTDYTHATTALRTAVDAATRDRTTLTGLREIAELLTRRTELVADIVTEATRQQTIRRLNTAEKALTTAAGAVLDSRFTEMSETITKWWTTIRPDELVGFGGIKRRAGGTLFVNLIAALRIDFSSPPVTREALGVYSDSQLNALGLSIFLARTELLGARVVVLDDPIPGSDSDHRLTFVQETLAALLDAGVQVIVTTFDARLAEWAYASHGSSRNGLSYRLDLIDVIAGPEPTKTADAFGQLMLEAQESLNSPTAKGRRSACNTLRTAAERLAKQIIATGHTHAGTPTSVADIKVKTLGNLNPLVLPLVVGGNAEQGHWKLFPKVLNPGSHDDDVPSSTELKQTAKNLRKIAKAHQNHWPGGLLQ
ncbi:MAG: AAA family ATPase, partial [Mycobacterium sp.]